MTPTLLMIDGNYLCYRAHYAQGKAGLAHGGHPTGVIYGVLRDLLVFTRDLGTENVTFCFDRGQSLREQEYPWYKLTRRQKREAASAEDKLTYDRLQEQVRRLRKEILPRLGFAVRSVSGYEADDMIAAELAAAGRGTYATIISADRDLYQCLTDRVAQYDPRKKTRLTIEEFVRIWNLGPARWPEVKATAGCPTDDVPGCTGEKTAAKFIRGVIRDGTIMYNRIYRFRKTRQYEDNLRVVTLPYDGYAAPEGDRPPTKIKWDEWGKVAAELGMNSIKSRDGLAVGGHDRQPVRRKTQERQRRGLFRG